MKIGQPEFFDVNHYLESVKQMASADEVVTALEMLDKLPGYYRDNEPKEVTELRNDILSKVETVADYCRHDLEHYSIAIDYEKQMCDARASFHGTEAQFEDLGDMINDSFCFPRGPMILNLVKKLNEQGKTPHIVELGPASYWLPHALKKKGCKFKYKPISINRVAEQSHSVHLNGYYETDLSKSDVKIFVCFEVLEHLWNEKDLLFEAKKQKVDFDIVAISAPLNTFGGGEADRKTFEHIRTYNAKEFRKLCSDMFPERNWVHALNQSQVMIGSKSEYADLLSGLDIINENR